MPQFEVELPDGTIIEGPTKEAALAGARKRLATTAKPEAPKEAAPSNFDNFLNTLATPFKQTANAALEYGPGILGGIAGAEAGPLGASAGAATADYLVKRLRGQEPSIDTGSDVLNPIVNIGAGTAMNEIGGKLLQFPGKILNSLKNAAAETEIGKTITGKAGGIATEIRDKLIQTFGINQAKGSVVGAKAALDPTYSQYGTTEDRQIANAIEDVLAPHRKAEAVANTQKLAAQEAQKNIENLTGIKIDLSEGLEREVDQLRPELKARYQEAVNASNAEGEVARVIAESNPHQTAIQVPSGLVGANGKPLTKIQYIVTHGPIPVDETQSAVQSILDDVTDSVIKPDPGDKLIATATRINDLTQGGKVPLSFEDAWKAKQDIGEYVATHYDQGTANFLSREYNLLRKSLNKDIETGITKWTNNPDQALTAFQNAKRIVAARESAFAPRGAANTAKQVMLNDSKEQFPKINNIIDDSKELQKFVNAGDRDILLNDKANTVVSFAKTNTRKTLGAYQVKRMLQDAWKTDPNTGLKVFDGVKLLSSIDDPAMKDSLNILYGSQGRTNIRQFFKILHEVDQKRIQGGATYLKLRGALGAFSLGAGIAQLFVGGKVPFGAQVGGAVVGAILTGAQVGKLLTNPTTARLMQAMAQGGPLNMSTQAAARILAQALRHESVTTTLADGSEVKGTMGADGKLSEK